MYLFKNIQGKFLSLQSEVINPLLASPVTFKCTTDDSIQQKLLIAKRTLQNLTTTKVAIDFVCLV